MIYTITKNSLQLFFIIFSSFLFAQNADIKEIDALLMKCFNSRAKYNNIDALQYAKQASNLAEKTGNSERKAKSYYEMALLTLTPELQKQSLIFTNKAYEEPYTKQNIPLQARIKELKFYNYSMLGLTSQSMKELFGAVKLLENRTDGDSERTITSIYGNIGNYYQTENKLDSAAYYYKKIYNLVKGFSKEIQAIRLPECYLAMGDVFRERKMQDSALYYYQKSYQFKIKHKNPSVFMEYICFGDYYKAEKENQKALNFYLKSLDNIKESKVNIEPYLFVYEEISSIYGILGNKQLQNEYQEKYNQKIRDANELKIKNTEKALNIILKDNESQLKESQKRIYLWISLCVLALFISLLFIYRTLRNKLKQKESEINQVTTHLEQKEKIISEKNEETKELQQKINDAYNEVINLAQNNDPAFYFRFLEVYPEFQTKMLKEFPGLRNSELILCAYTYLGFTIKDVAEYTYKSVNTVRNRKQNLRKKFNIPTEQDMGIWLRELINPNQEN